MISPAHEDPLTPSSGLNNLVSLDRDTESPTTVLDASWPSLQRRLHDKAMHLQRLAGSKQLDGSSLIKDGSAGQYELTDSQLRAVSELFLLICIFTEKAVPVWLCETMKRALCPLNTTISHIYPSLQQLFRVHCAGMCDCFSADTAQAWHRWLRVANLLSCSFPFHSCLIIVVHKMFTAANAAQKPHLDTRHVASSHHWHRHVTSTLKTKAFWCQCWSSTTLIVGMNVYFGPSRLHTALN